MQYTKLELKLIEIRKLLPTALDAGFVKMLENNKVKIQKRLIESRSYFFNNN